MKNKLLFLDIFGNLLAFLNLSFLQPKKNLQVTLSNVFKQF